LLFQHTSSLRFSVLKRPVRGKQEQKKKASRRHIDLVASQRLVDKIFDNADTNHDGTVNFSEVYELVLKFYIQINRQAPINPPSRKRVFQLFLNADTSRNRRLNREEFKGLANLLAKGAVVRVIAHKLVTLVGAPLLAESIIHTLTGTSILPEVVNFIVPNRYKAKILPIITSYAFCRTVLVIILVCTLGNVVLNCVNLILHFRLEDEDKDERLKNYERIR